MSCQEIQEALGAFRDGEAPTTRSVTPQAVERHLAGCDECRDVAADFERIGRWLEAPVSQFAADPNFVARFRQRLDQSLGMPAAWWRGLALRLVPLSIAAAIAAVALSGGEHKEQPLVELERDVLATGSPDGVESFDVADWTIAWLGDPAEGE